MIYIKNNTFSKNIQCTYWVKIKYTQATVNCWVFNKIIEYAGWCLISNYNIALF